MINNLNENDDIKTSFIGILSLYKDGDIEEIDVGIERYHMDYYHAFYYSSDKFKSILDEYIMNVDFENDFNSLPIVSVLAKEGVISIHNCDIYELFDNPNSHYLPSFNIYLPNEVSQKQINGLYKLFKNYPLEKISFLKYKDTKFVRIPKEKYMEYLHNFIEKGRKKKL